VNKRKMEERCGRRRIKARKKTEEDWNGKRKNEGDEEKMKKKEK
jgi:hypothetical protein